MWFAGLSLWGSRWGKGLDRSEGGGSCSQSWKNETRVCPMDKEEGESCERFPRYSQNANILGKVRDQVSVSLKTCERFYPVCFLPLCQLALRGCKEAGWPALWSGQVKASGSTCGLFRAQSPCVRMELGQPPQAKSARTWPGAQLGTWFTGKELRWIQLHCPEISIHRVPV